MVYRSFYDLPDGRGDVTTYAVDWPEALCFVEDIVTYDQNGVPGRRVITVPWSSVLGLEEFVELEPEEQPTS